MAGGFLMCYITKDNYLYPIPKAQHFPKQDLKWIKKGYTYSHLNCSVSICFLFFSLFNSYIFCAVKLNPTDGFLSSCEHKLKLMFMLFELGLSTNGFVFTELLSKNLLGHSHQRISVWQLVFML